MALTIEKMLKKLQTYFLFLFSIVKVASVTYIIAIINGTSLSATSTDISDSELDKMITSL